MLSKVIPLGAIVRDRVSGIRGQVLGRSEFLYASPRVFVAVRECDTDGKPQEASWFDESRMEVLGVEPVSRFRLEPVA